MKVIDFHCDTLSVIRSMQSRGIRVDFEKNNLSYRYPETDKGRLSSSVFCRVYRFEE